MSIDPSTYKTGNASPSNSAEDLSDNARVFDVFMNDKSGDSVLDRLGAPIPTLSKALQGISWVSVGEWSTNPTITEPNQYVFYNNQRFAPVNLPYTVDSAAHTDPNDLVPSELRDVSQFLTSSELADIGGLTFSTIAAMKSYGNLSDGNKVNWQGYYSQSDGGSNWGIVKSGSHVEDGGKIFSIDANLYVEANHPRTSLMWGVKTNTTLDPQEAANNRQQIERMLRNADISTFKLNNEGTVNVLGSIHPLRSNIKIKHQKGCHIAGYLDDPSVTLLSAGHVFGFAQYADPDNRDFTITGVTSDLEYQLDGSIESVYRAVHTNPHNNNCFGFNNSERCTVRGSGGVTGSDHRGINFDYDSENCIIDVSYIKGCSNEPAIIRGKDTKSQFNKVKVRSIEAAFDSGVTSNYRCVDITNTNRAVVQINAMASTNAIKPNLVNASNCGILTVEVGSVRDISQVVRSSSCNNVIISGVEITNLQCLVARSGDATDALKSIKVSGLQCFGTLPSLYRDDRAPADKVNGFDILSIKDCDFSQVTGETKIWDVPLSAAGPRIYELEDNITHPGWSSPQIFNKMSYLETLAFSNTSFTYDIAGENGDYPYSQLHGRIVQGAFAYPFEFDLTIIARTGYNQVVSVFHENGAKMKVSTVKAQGGQVVTFTLDNASTGGALGDVIVSN